MQKKKRGETHKENLSGMLLLCSRALIMICGGAHSAASVTALMADKASCSETDGDIRRGQTLEEDAQK